jgi:hypothetical protein
MTDTIRELIIKEFVARAAVIVSTGTPQLYATDIGGNVLRSRPKVSPDDLPCCVIHPGAVEEAAYKFGMVHNSMTMRVDGIVSAGVSDPAVIAEQILGDLIRAFTDPAWDRRRIVTGPPVSYLAPYADLVMYQSAGTDDIPEDGAVTAGASIRMMVMYWTAIGDPYMQ